MQKIIEKGGIRNDLMKKRLDRMSTKVTDMQKRVKSIEETGRYLVKVADSCPLAIEQQRLQ
jgi:NADH:ubiquinone oxidoreductase subunit D